MTVDRKAFLSTLAISSLFLLFLRVFLMDANPILPDFQELLAVF